MYETTYVTGPDANVTEATHTKLSYYRGMYIRTHLMHTIVSGAGMPQTQSLYRAVRFYRNKPVWQEADSRKWYAQKQQEKLASVAIVPAPTSVLHMGKRYVLPPI